MKFISFLNKYKFYILLLMFGLFIFTYPMLKSGFDLLPGDGIDPKSINYILEHSFQWLIRTPKHEHYWTAPFYYPHVNNLAFSDSLMGLDPIYWVFRIFCKPMSAFQGMFIVLCILNYSTFYYLLKKNFKLTDLASSMGAYIFAFGLLRFFRIIHLNYYSQFYTILALIFLFKVNKNNSILKNNIFMFLSVASLALQFYSCYTLGWGFSVLFFAGLIFSLAFPETRKKVFDFFKSFYKLLIIYFIVFILLMIPFAMIYLSLGFVRTIDDVIYHLQNQFCWVKSLSRLDNFFLRNLPYEDYYERGEISAASGVITTVIALVGIWFSSKIAKAKGLNWTLYFVLTLAFFMSCTVNNIFMWDFLYGKIPGIEGIRAIVRISYIGLIVISIGVAYFVQNFRLDKLKQKIILSISIFFLLLEQIPYYADPNSYWISYGWSKSVFEQQIKEELEQIPDGYDVLFFTFVPSNIEGVDYGRKREVYYMRDALLQGLAIWCALYKNLYSINGLSGVEKSDFPDIGDLKLYDKDFVFDLDNFDDREYLMKGEK